MGYNENLRKSSCENGKEKDNRGIRKGSVEWVWCIFTESNVNNRE